MNTIRALMVVAALTLSVGCDQVREIVDPEPEYDGAFLIVEADVTESIAVHLQDMSEQMATTLRDAGIRYNGRGVSDGVVRIRLLNAADTQRALSAMAPITGHMTLSAQPDGLIEGRLDDEYLVSTANQLTQRSIPALQARFDRRIATVERYEAGRLIVRTTENRIPDAVRDVFSQQGRLTFHLVREVSPDERVPVDAMLVGAFDPRGMPEVVERRSLLTSERLVRAAPSTDPQTGEFVLSFEFDDQGRNTFCRLTREHTGERFAILLDNRVLSAPTINEPICGGSGQISGNFTAESANKLANILRARTLPVPLRIVEERDAMRLQP